MTLKLYQRRILFSLLILSIILCGISFIFPTVEVANIDGTENLTFFLWGGQWNIKQNDFPFPKLFLYPSMVGPLRELASSIPAGDSYKDIFNSVKTQIVGYIFLTLTLLLFVLALIFGIKGLFHMYRGDIKKEQSWVFSSGVTAILAIVLYFVIMSFIILPPSNVSYNISHVSWGAGFYLFLFGGVMLTFVGSRGYLIQINEELKKDISEDPKTAKTKKADVVYKTEKEKKDKKTEYPVQQNPWKPRTKIITVVAIIIVAVIIAAASLVLFTAGDTHKFVGTWVGTESGSTTFLFLTFHGQNRIHFNSNLMER